MTRHPIGSLDRRQLVAWGAKSLALASLAPCGFAGRLGDAANEDSGPEVAAVVRPRTLFAGIRRPISSRAELEPRIELLQKVCGSRICGPLTHIFRFDTPVEGYDSEIGYPVSARVDAGPVKTHTLRELSFFAIDHHGPDATIPATRRHLYATMNRTGLSPELELMEIFEHRDGARPERSRTRLMASFLAWPEIYRTQLERVLGSLAAAAIWSGGEAITPHTPVDERAAWVGASITRLKAASSTDQQYDILSRVALVRPPEDVAPYREIYERTGSLDEVLRAQEAHLRTRAGKRYPQPWSWDGTTLHLSKVPYNQEAYDAATTSTERRRAYCFCNLVREAENPAIDPIFCFRAAGWSRQFFEPILGCTLDHCTITHSILKGDACCAWNYRLA